MVGTAAVHELRNRRRWVRWTSIRVATFIRWVCCFTNLLTGDDALSSRQRLKLEASVRRVAADHTGRGAASKPSTQISTLEAGLLPSIGGGAAHRDQGSQRRLGQQVRGDLDWIVMKALEKDRARRYETAGALASDVLHYFKNEPVAAGPPSAAYRLRKFAARNRAALAMGGLLAAALLLGVAVATWQAVRATRAERLARERLAAEQQAHDEAERERERAEANLELAMQALDEIYLGAMEDDRLASHSAGAVGEQKAIGDRFGPLSAADGDWLNRGLEFYDLFARQNETVSDTAAGAARAYHRVGAFQASRGSLEAAAKAYRAAIEKLERLSRTEPDDADHFSKLGDAYRGLAHVLLDGSAEKEKLTEAFQAYSRAIEMRPNDPLLYLSRAEIASSLNEWRQAAQDYDKAAETCSRQRRRLARLLQFLSVGKHGRARLGQGARLRRAGFPFGAR